MKRLLHLAGGAFSVFTGYRGAQYIRRRNEENSHHTVTVHDDFFRNENGESKKKTALVIGGGVAGVCTAYSLSKRGYKVAILESGEVGEQCSKAAAGGMQRMSVRLNRTSWISTLKSMAPRSPFSDAEEDLNYFHMNWFDAFSDPQYLRWFLQFSRTSLSPEDASSTYRYDQVLAFTDWSILQLLDLMKDKKLGLGEAAHLSTEGALRLIMSEADLQQVRKSSFPSWTPNVVDREPTTILTTEETLGLAPWLKKSHQVSKILGAAYQLTAARANSHWFTQKLASNIKEEFGVRVWANTRVEGFETSANGDGTHEIKKVLTSQGTMELADDTVVVVAAGAWTPLLMRKLGLYVPQYPLKGYNLLVDLNTAPNDIEQSINANHMVSHGPLYVSRFDNQLRLASIGEFDGWNVAPCPRVERELRNGAAKILPDLKEQIEHAPVAVGLRPYVADGCPILGQVDVIPKLFINTGPGFNGWKIAYGASEVVARIIENGGDAKVVGDELGFDLSVSSPVGRVVKAPFFTRLCNFFSAWH